MSGVYRSYYRQGFISGVLCALLMVAAVIVIVLVSARFARGHGAHQWVADMELSDPISHESCCSKNPDDCQTLAAGDVEEVDGGWLIKTKAETQATFVAYRRGIPASQDGLFHRCGYPSNNGILGDKSFSIRCLIVPPESM